MKFLATLAMASVVFGVALPNELEMEMEKRACECPTATTAVSKCLAEWGGPKFASCVGSYVSNFLNIFLGGRDWRDGEKANGMGLVLLLGWVCL